MLKRYPKAGEIDSLGFFRDVHETTLLSLFNSIDALVKSPIIVMPDLIRHPEVVEFTGFRLSPE